MTEIMETIKEIRELIKEITEDRSVPKNIRSVLEEVEKKITKKNIESINVSNAIYQLEDISNDTNMPSYSRTTIWEIINLLEEIKEKIK